jgi:hypothetical protein
MVGDYRNMLRKEMRIQLKEWLLVTADLVQ